MAAILLTDFSFPVGDNRTGRGNGTAARAVFHDRHSADNTGLAIVYNEKPDVAVPPGGGRPVLLAVRTSSVCSSPGHLYHMKLSRQMRPGFPLSLHSGHSFSSSSSLSGSIPVPSHLRQIIYHPGILLSNPSSG